MSNLSSYGYGVSDTEHLGVAAYGYGQGVPLGLIANLDLLTTLNSSLEVPSTAANLIQATLSLETSFDASLHPLVAEILASLDLETQLDAALSQPIVELVANLGLETDLDTTLQFITIGELLTSLNLTTDIDGALQFITISELVASLNLTTDLDSSLQFITIGQLLASLDLESSLATSLYQPIADLLASLDLSTSLTSALEFIVIEELLANLDLQISLASQLQFIPLSELLASLDLETSFTSALQFIPIQEILASLDLETSHQVVLDPPIASVKEIEALLGLEVEMVTAFLVPKKLVVGQEYTFGGVGSPPPGFDEFLKRHGPILSLRAIGEAPPEIQEYLRRNPIRAYTSGYIFFPVLSVEFKPSDYGSELNPKLIVIGEPQTISYEPKKPGGATLWKP